VDCLDQQLGPGVLEQEAAGAGLEGAVHVLVEVEGGDDDDRERIVDVRPGELSGGLDAVHVGHPPPRAMRSARRLGAWSLVSLVGLSAFLTAAKA
jgi:hypothetical protein